MTGRRRFREWELSPHEARLLEGGLGPERFVALVENIKAKAVEEANREEAAQAARAAAESAASAERFREWEFEGLKRQEAENTAAFERLMAERQVERERRERWTPPSPIEQLRP